MGASDVTYLPPLPTPEPFAFIPGVSITLTTWAVEADMTERSYRKALRLASTFNETGHHARQTRQCTTQIRDVPPSHLRSQIRRRVPMDSQSLQHPGLSQCGRPYPPRLGRALVLRTKGGSAIRTLFCGASARMGPGVACFDVVY